MTEWFHSFNQFLGVTPIVGALLVLGYLVAALFPVLFSIALALAKRPRLDRKVLFCFMVTTVTYGTLLFFELALRMPATAYYRFYALQRESDGLSYSSSVTQFSYFMGQYDFVVYPAAAVAIALIFGLYLARRWNQAVGAVAA